ncbi:6fce2d43-c04b-4caa-af37-c13631011c1b-CDS [Sclerotinia trifoliorum]|uniref:6fce2d43-c04b-4caa-af37-c13631011c1b-CDS n=1 Tax=Sclerotinia trifoliorum TaxID=28548 RepID=A0A8H2W319_9HELO|nr:6fce2d43-c04b-4caa-af37-c13631011c1b-CDS [Sclerotinia trifoliorum]
MSGASNEFKVIATTEYKGTTVEVVDGNLLNYPVDVIVNAANASLVRGGGIDGQIHRKAGPQLAAEMKTQFPHPGKEGGAYGTTHSWNIKSCRYIIHAVGPDWRQPNQRDTGLLANAYRNSLSLAAKNNLRSIAFPAISVGIFQMPRGMAGVTVMKTIRSWIDSHQGEMDRISILLFDLGQPEIAEMQYPNLQLYIPNDGPDRSNEPAAAFRSLLGAPKLPVPPPATTVDIPPPQSKLIKNLQGYSDDFGTPDPPSGLSVSPTPPPGTTNTSSMPGTTASVPIPVAAASLLPPGPPTGSAAPPGRPSESPSDSMRETSPEFPIGSPTGSPSKSPSKSPPRSPPRSPSGSPPAPPPRPGGGRGETPSDSDEEPPSYLLKFYEPLSHMWMGRDRYYALLEAGLDPETFYEGMMIPDPEKDPNTGALTGEEKVVFDKYHQERIERGEEIMTRLHLPTVQKDKDARDKDNIIHAERSQQILTETAIRTEAKVEVWKEGVEKDGMVHCTTLEIGGDRCRMRGYAALWRDHLFPDRCFRHQKD